MENKDTIRTMIRIIKDIVIRYFVTEEGRWWQGKFLGGGGFVPAGRLENKYDKNDILFSVGFFFIRFITNVIGCIILFFG